MTLPAASVSANSQVYAYSIWSLLQQSVLYDPDHALEKDPEAFEKMQRDAVISGAFDQLHIQVAGADWTFTPGGAKPEDRRLAAIAEQLLKHTQRFPSILYNLAMADFKGCTWAVLDVGEEVLTIGDGKPRLWTVVKSAKDVDKRRIQLRQFPTRRLDPETGVEVEGPPAYRWTVYARGAWRDSSSVWWKELDDVEPTERWVQHVVDTSERGMGYGYGLAADIYYLFYIKTQALKTLMQGLGRWGNGIVTHGIDGLRDGEPSGTPGGTANQAAVTKASAALQTLVKMRQEASYVYDSRDKIDIMHMPSDGAQFCIDVIHYCDVCFRRRILGPAPGAESDAEGGKGSNAREKVREAQGRDKVRFLQAALETTWDERVTYPVLLGRNMQNLRELGLHEAAKPTLRIAGRESYDPEIGGRTLFSASQLGMPVRKDEAYARLGLTPPNEGDEVLDPKQVAMLARGNAALVGQTGSFDIMGDRPKLDPNDPLYQMLQQVGQGAQAPPLGQPTGRTGPGSVQPSVPAPPAGSTPEPNPGGTGIEDSTMPRSIGNRAPE